MSQVWLTIDIIDRCGDEIRRFINDTTTATATVDTASTGTTTTSTTATTTASIR